MLPNGTAVTNSSGEDMYAMPPLVDFRRQDKSMTLPEILSDPLIQAVMAADGVNPSRLAAELRRVALALQRQPIPDPNVDRCYVC
jgi:hypothetical protein